MYYDSTVYGISMVSWGALPPSHELPVDEADAIWREHLEHVAPCLVDWLAPQTDEPYWRTGSVAHLSTASSVRCSLIGGWRDGYPNPPLRLFAGLDGRCRLLTGPWNHTQPDRAIPARASTTCTRCCASSACTAGVSTTGSRRSRPLTLFMQRFQPSSRIAPTARDPGAASARGPCPGRAPSPSTWGPAARSAMCRPPTARTPPLRGERRGRCRPLVRRIPGRPAARPALRRVVLARLHRRAARRRPARGRRARGHAARSVDSARDGLLGQPLRGRCGRRVGARYEGAC